MKRIYTVLIILLVSFQMTAQDVVREELFKVNKDSVEFLNYEGPHSKFETAAEIRGIGNVVGLSLSKGSIDAEYFNKYRVLHIIDKDSGRLLNADIFSIEKDAVVDHIKNIRRILSGYLESFYGFPGEDANIIAEFITYYNAYYRKNMEYFKSIYAGAVINSLVPEKAGISTRYMEWPGNTQMLIPLSSDSGGSVNLDTVSNKDVIEDLRTKEDKGIEPRKGMVEVKEKEITAEQKRIEAEKETLEEEKKALSEEKAAAVNNGTQSDQKSLESIALKEETLKQKEDAIRAREEANNKRQEAVQQEREQIAEDEKQIIEKKAAAGDNNAVTAEADSFVPFLFISDDDPDLMGRFVLINSKTGVINKESSLNTVRGRKFFLLNNSLLFISGIDRPPKAVRLILMNKATLEIEVEGKHDIYAESSLLIKDSSVYAVTRKNGKWYVARFNTNLKLQEMSDIEVMPFTPFLIEKGKLYIETKQGKIKPLDAVTLKLLP